MAFNPASTLRRSRGAFVVTLLLSAGIFVGAGVMKEGALTSEQAQAQSRTRAIANEIDGLLDTASLQTPIDAATAAQLDTRLGHALSGEDVMAVRVWTPAGTLRYSSLPRDRSIAIEDSLRESTKGLGRLTSSVDGEVFTTYAPLRAGADGAPFGAVEIQQPYGPVLAAASQPWSPIRTIAAAMGAIAVILLGWGLLGALPARRAAREGAGFVSPTKDDPSGSLHEALLEADATLAEAQDARTALEGELGAERARALAEREGSATRTAELERDASQANAKVHELERVLARERLDAAGAGERLANARARVAELEQRLAGETEEPPAQDTRVAASADARANALEAELAAALERARAAEDLAAALQDRLTEPAAERSPLDAWTPPSGDADEPEEGAASLRSRIARTAARKKPKRRDEPQWP